MPIPPRPRLLVASVIALLAVAAGGLTACSDDGPTIDEYADAFARSIRADQDDDTVEVGDDEAACIGAAVAERLGLDRLEAVGSPEEVEAEVEGDLAVFDLSADESLAIADDYIGCVPDFVEQFAASLGVDRLTTCLAEQIQVGDLRVPTAVAIRGDEPGDDDVAFVYEAITTCENIDPALTAYVEAIAEGVVADAGDSLGITDGEATCFAQNAVSVIGAERITSFGGVDDYRAATADDLSALELSSAELEQVARGYFLCSPDVAARFRSLFLDGTGLTGEQRQCVDERVSDQVLIAIIAASLGGQAPEGAVEGLDDELRACA